MSETLKYILIINPFGIGDVLFSTALLEAIGRQVEGCHIGFLCNRRTETLLKNNPMVDWIFVFEKDEYRELWKTSKLKCVGKFFSLFREIKAKRFDTVIDLSLSRQFGFLAWAMGIPKRVGFNYRNRGLFLTRRITIDGYKDKHIVEYYLDLLRLAGLDAAANYLMLYVSDEDRKWAKDFLASNGIGDTDFVVGIVPAGGASWGRDASVKHWRADGFARVADGLVEKKNAKVIIFGDESETCVCQRVRDNMKSAAVTACAETTLLQFAALIGMCGLVIANDGGPLHIAVAMGTRTVGIFGPVDEKVYGQYPSNGKHRVVGRRLDCRPCYRNFKLAYCRARRCLDEITADDVLGAAEEALRA